MYKSFFQIKCVVCIRRGSERLKLFDMVKGGPMSFRIFSKN